MLILIVYVNVYLFVFWFKNIQILGLYRFMGSFICRYILNRFIDIFLVSLEYSGFEGNIAQYYWSKSLFSVITL